MDKFLSNKIFLFLKKHIVIVCAIIVAAILLSVTFLAGGRLDNNISTPVSATADTASTNVTSTTTADIFSATENNSENDNSSESTTETKVSDAATASDTTATVSSSKTAQNSSDTSSSVKISNDNSSNNSNNSNVSGDNSKNTGNSSSQNATAANKDKYLTDPIPSGKPEPVEPQDQEVSDTELTCTFSISCATILDNIGDLDKNKLELVPNNGWILKPTKVTFNEGESVYDVLVRVCKDNKIHMEASWTPIYNSAYVEGINNLYEFDCGSLSGWMYSVNDWFPNYGCSRYELKQGDVVEWKYTCNLGYDVGGGYAVGE